VAAESQIEDVRVEAEDGVPRNSLPEVRATLESLQRYTDEPIVSARLTLRVGAPGSKRPYVADGSVSVAERLLAAHTSGATPEEAADAAVDRLRRQLRRRIEKDIALRNEQQLDFDVADRPEARLKPPAQRQIVHRHPYLGVPIPTLDAIDELLALDLEFFLFTHSRTNEDVVVHRRDDGRIGLIHPRDSVLADEGDDVVVPEPNRYSEPLTLQRAREEMDMLNHRFLYFIDAEDGRGHVLYLRHDGDYGLVVPH
jgi:ribosome-associated translation inhibitor RaiA